MFKLEKIHKANLLILRNVKLITLLLSTAVLVLRFQELHGPSSPLNEFCNLVNVNFELYNCFEKWRVHGAIQTS